MTHFMDTQNRNIPVVMLLLFCLFVCVLKSCSIRNRSELNKDRNSSENNRQHVASVRPTTAADRPICQNLEMTRPYLAPDVYHVNPSTDPSAASRTTPGRDNLTVILRPSDFLRQASLRKLPPAYTELFNRYDATEL
jgi:hypothetical protein